MNSVLSSWSQDYIKQTFGDIKYLENTKVFFSTFLYQNSSRQSLHVVTKNEFTPKFSNDWEMFCFLRSLCDVYVSSGEIVRKENNTNNCCEACFFGHEDWKDLFSIKSDKKLNYILSRKFRKDDLQMKTIKAPHLSTILTMNDDLQNEINEDVELQDYIKRQNIQFTPKMETTVDAVNYIKKRYPEDRILVELGVNSMRQIFDINVPELQPLETLIITVYKGELDEQFVGDEHPTIEQMEQIYNLVNVSEPQPIHKGYLQFYVFVNKSLNIDPQQELKSAKPNISISDNSQFKIIA